MPLCLHAAVGMIDVVMWLVGRWFVAWMYCGRMAGRIKLAFGAGVSLG